MIVLRGGEDDDRMCRFTAEAVPDLAGELGTGGRAVGRGGNGCGGLSNRRLLRWKV